METDHGEVGGDDIGTGGHQPHLLFNNMRAETFQRRTSVFIAIGSQRRMSKDNLDGRPNNLGDPKEETLARLNNKDMFDIDERRVLDEEEMFWMMRTVLETNLKLPSKSVEDSVFVTCLIKMTLSRRTI